ncbi:Cof-type HAD-IIB family hydrolase [Fructilactobacillus carniphilus]|uniref:Cof-type HAD-IIB family hydrolase n=1 Tax=Fructilactobacillus carniphilus TaxID=2940297 RepID=A0ABY5BVT7_9LACO|nr:Cof-type HAD-IIB family hydrolase [Fructilactobacillus carniphilus]USS90604.1 Cof-type HAD-IIB family hydrolase [Fructilactobacillus carniphilus]
MIKLIALDLDNTLLNSQKQISLANERELRCLHEAGMKVVLCTGRPINAIWNYIEQLGLTEPEDATITFNGGLVLDNTTRKVLAQRGMNKQSLQPLYQFAQEQGVPLDVLDFNRVYPVSDLGSSIYRDKLNGKIDFEPRSFVDLLEQECAKGILANTSAELDRLQQSLPDAVKQQYHIVRSQPEILEFLPPKVDKAVGLDDLLHHFGWDFSNLMAFGDAENDAGMLEKAAVGVAMGNASSEIKQIANQVTTTNDADGVAVFLRQYFSKQ